MMVGAKLYINFDGKHEFNTAYQMLVKEMKGKDKPSNPLGEFSKIESSPISQLGLLNMY